jgi:hypothetical protein
LMHGVYDLESRKRRMKKLTLRDRCDAIDGYICVIAYDEISSRFCYYIQMVPL